MYGVDFFQENRVFYPKKAAKASQKFKIEEKISKFAFVLSIPILFMSKARILFVSQEMLPYSPETDQAKIARELPQAIQESDKEIRVFMPRFGKINERRHQLHEVIRLSGMNLVVNDMDFPLIIKVASLPEAKMQVYFIDNEEFFRRKSYFHDEEGKSHPDNDERSIFYCKGVIETVKKLGWSPDIIHCHGWMSALIPLYLKQLFKDEPMYQDTKLVFSAFGAQSTDVELNQELMKKVAWDGIPNDLIDIIENPTTENLNLLGAKMADGVILNDSLSDEMRSKIESFGVPTISHDGSENMADAYNAFYDEVMASDSVMADS